MCPNVQPTVHNDPATANVCFRQTRETRFPSSKALPTLLCGMQDNSTSTPSMQTLFPVRAAGVLSWSCCGIGKRGSACERKGAVEAARAAQACEGRGSTQCRCSRNEGIRCWRSDNARSIARRELIQRAKMSAGKLGEWWREGRGGAWWCARRKRSAQRSKCAMNGLNTFQRFTDRLID